MNTDVDVIVIGAGIVGQALALGLAQQSYTVAIVDSGEAPNTDVAKEQEQAVYSSRVTAISRASQQLLTELEAWPYIGRKQRYTHMEVWDKDGFGHINFNCNEISDTAAGKACLGHIIENEEINKALHKAIHQQNKVQGFYQCAVSNIIVNAEQAKVELEDGSVLNAKLLVGADGANSIVRTKMGFAHTFWDYDHIAIVANVKTELPHNNTARQAFTPFGPLAFLPLSDPHTCSIVFSQQSKQAKALLGLSDEGFEQALLLSIDNQYGHINLLTERSSFPLRMRYARQWTSAHVALVGDAAHTIHPLAGQGANLGLADAQALLSIMAQHPTRLGDAYILRKYERWRKTEALKVIATMEGFKRLFDGEQPLKKLLRNTALLGAQKLPMLKAFFIKQAAS